MINATVGSRSLHIASRCFWRWLVLLAIVCAAGRARAECFDYAHQMHLEGHYPVDIGSGVAVSGNLAFTSGNESGLLVFDVSDPAAPLLLSVFGPPHSSGVAVRDSLVYLCERNGLAIIDVHQPTTPVELGSLEMPEISWNVALSGNHAYVADGLSGIQVVDVSDPAHPWIVSNVGTNDEARSVAVVGDYAYVVEYYRFEIFDVSDPANPELLGFRQLPCTMACGLAVEGSYAYVADWTSGLLCLDISNPENPRIVGTAPVQAGAIDVALSGTVAFVTTNSVDLVAVDVSNPSAPQPMGRVFFSGVLAWGVAVAGNHAFVASNTAGLEVVDIESPYTVPILGTADTPDQAHDVTVSGEIAYVADQNAGLQVVDVSQVTSPHIIGSVDTPGTAWSVALSGSLALVADYHSGIQIVDISSPGVPLIVGSVDTPGHAGKLAVSGLHAFVADDSSLQVVDFADPAHPYLQAGLALPSAIDIALAGGHAFVALGTSGFGVVDITDPAWPQLVSLTDTPGYAGGIAVEDGLLAVADDRALRLFNVTIPSQPASLGVVEFGVTGNSHVILRPPFAYAVTGGRLVSVIDVSDPASPILLGSFSPQGTSHGMYLDDNQLFVANGYAGLRILPLQCDPAAVEPPPSGVPSPILSIVPSPCRLGATIRLGEGIGAGTRVSIHDVTGRTVRCLTRDLRGSGPDDFRWDGTGDDGRLLPAGVYLVRAEGPGTVASTRVVLVR